VVNYDTKLTNYHEVLSEKYNKIPLYKEVIVPTEKQLVVDVPVAPNQQSTLMQLETYKETVTEEEQTRDIHLKKTIEKIIPKSKIVERRVPKKVDLIVEVPVVTTVIKQNHIIKEVFIELENIVEVPVYMDNITDKNNPASQISQTVILEKEKLANEQLILQLQAEINQLSIEIEQLNQQQALNKSKIVETKIGENENLLIREQLVKMHGLYNEIVKQTYTPNNAKTIDDICAETELKIQELDNEIKGID